MHKLIILDRDGVINHDSDEYIKVPEEWYPIDGSLEAIAALKQAGFTVVVITNQSGIGRNLLDHDDFADICTKMDVMLDAVGGSIDAIYYCPHTPDDHCDCRKPKTGLYEYLQEELGVDLAKIAPYAVGDSLRDLQAAKSAGCKPILVLTGNGNITATAELPAGTQTYRDLAAFSQVLLENEVSSL